MYAYDIPMYNYYVCLLYMYVCNVLYVCILLNVHCMTKTHLVPLLFLFEVVSV